MSKIKEFYFEEISQGLEEAKDKFADDEYQVDEYQAELIEMERQMEQNLEYKLEEADFEKIYELTGTYPI
jgi:hypothetical protein